MWDRLQSAGSAVRRGRATPAELDQYVDDYLHTSADLSAVRSRTDDPALLGELTRTVGTASSTVYGTSARSRAAVGDFLLLQLPAALYVVRWRIALAALVFLLPAVLMGAFIVTEERALPVIGDEEQLQQFVEGDFLDYYTEQPNPVFAAAVGTNNILVGLIAFGAGALGGLPALYVLAFNGLNVGAAGGVIHAYGRPDIFWYSILPHGLLELTAIVVAGGIGMHVGWTLLAPGDRTRGDALAEEGQRAAVVAVGLIMAFSIAALIEGFVTPRTWSPLVEIGIGALGLALFAVPAVVRGRAAAEELAAARSVAGGARVVGERSGTGRVWRRTGEVTDARGS